MVYDMVIKSKAGSQRKTLIIVSLILVTMVISSLYVYWFLMVDNDGSIRVKNASELRDAVNNAEVSVPTTIILTRDISLGTLFIPAGADITLTSVGSNDVFFKLIGSTDESVITVQSSGRLILDGVIVTHTSGFTGSGVAVELGGTLILVDGEISGNTATYGGGVSNSGSFVMTGGSITDNIAISRGGGIFSGGTFTMSGGVISNNQAEYGGGVDGGASFSMSGGEISDNTAMSGGGVFVRLGTFTMSGGVISNNQATEGYGGGVYNYYGMFNSSGGEISGNKAAVGNDVHQKLNE